MKAKKIIFLNITSLGLLLGSVSPSTSCSKNNANIVSLKFTCSEGISLRGDTQITIAKGTKWGDLLNDNRVPEPDMTSDYTPIGWCRQTSVGSWQLMQNNDVIEADAIIKFFAFNNKIHPITTVTLNFSPDQEVTPAILDFAIGFTLHEFRAFYNLIEIPTMEGYQFDGFYKVTSSNEEIKIDDSYKFIGNDYIKIKWNVEQYTATITTDGKGSVDKNSVTFDYNSTFETIANQITLTPHEGYKFDKWVDEKGEEILAETKMKNDFLVEATFAPIPKYAINFSCSEGVQLEPDTPISVFEGTVWCDIKDIPTATVTTGYTDLGWFAICDDGTFQEIKPNFVVARGLNAKYIAYDPSQYVIPVKYYSDPIHPEKFVEFKAAKKSTFKEFREYYEIPVAPAVEGYTFKGFYLGDDTLINDDWTFPESSGPIEIKAKFEQQKFTISLITDGHGTLSKTELVNVPYGTKWSDAIKDVYFNADPEYEFDCWIYNDGSSKPIEDDYKITKSFTALARFRLLSQPIFQLLGHKHCVMDLDYQKQFQNINSYYLSPGWNSNYYNEPTFFDNKLHYDTAKRCCNGRLMVSTFAIHIPVPPKTTRKTKLNIDGQVKMWLNGHFLGSLVQTTCQVFKLNSSSDGPSFYNNNDSGSDTRATDPRCVYVKGDKHEKKFPKGWTNWSFEYNLDTSTIHYEDTNDDASSKIFTHYFSVSFWIRGQDDFVNGNQGATCDYYFYTE